MCSRNETISGVCREVDFLFIYFILKSFFYQRVVCSAFSYLWKLAWKSVSVEIFVECLWIPFLPSEKCFFTHFLAVFLLGCDLWFWISVHKSSLWKTESIFIKCPLLRMPRRAQCLKHFRASFGYHKRLFIGRSWGISNTEVKSVFFR